MKKNTNGELTPGQKVWATFTAREKAQFLDNAREDKKRDLVYDKIKRSGYDKFDKFKAIRGAIGSDEVEVGDAEELAAALQKEAIHFSSNELLTFGRLAFDGSIAKDIALFWVPDDWLAEVFSALFKRRVVRTICDPWASIGLLMNLMLETTNAKIAYAFTYYESDAVLGKTLVGNANWYWGEPIEYLSAFDGDLDLAASLLPMWEKAEQPLTVKDLSGNDIILRGGALGEQILVAAAMQLGEEGSGIFVVKRHFFSSGRSVFNQFSALGLGLDAALALPLGAFTGSYVSPPSYLVIVRKHPVAKMFVAQLSKDWRANRQVLSNLARGKEGASLELGRFVDPLKFRGLDVLRAQERFEQTERLYGRSAVPLKQLATVINKGGRKNFEFQKLKNAIYVPLIGIRDVIDSLDDLALKPQSYAQVVINPERSRARFVVQFLNSEFGKETRNLSKSGQLVPRLNREMLGELPILVPDLQTQQAILEVEGRIADEQNTLIGLKNELAQIQRELWAKPQSIKEVDQRLSDFSEKLSGSLKRYAAAGLDQWFETLPFPLASILRAWQAAPSREPKIKFEHLLHFFEATAEFVSIILMSAFKSNEALFAQHKLKLNQSMQKSNLSFQRASFGTWKLVVEYLGKQTRDLLSGNDEDRLLCAEIFSDYSNALPKTVSSKELVNILAEANKMRNKTIGHGGIIGLEDAKRCNQQLLNNVQKLREVMADLWEETQLIQSTLCIKRKGVFENEVAILMGSNSEFLKESRTMSTCLDADLLYLLRNDETQALQLIPLMQIGPSPKSAINACYFYSRVDKEEYRFVSYHFIDEPKLNVPSSKLVSLSDLWAGT